ncbi:hypothetical protein [Amycolatopsis dendrobii]|uniref:Uncharacterized protein n=1 Tax=Amycolatopsis dendrobii TaxID=2760662 RepID=A0A7W3VUN9_9PSEU|nr:hypothetical protein [Amycolatopsis dendrobii]MBB1153546.1 hypothetical protein [Amycolatopsis dendrobii]
MFDRFREDEDARSALREVGLPRPVWVRVAEFVPAPLNWGRTASPWMRAGGLNAGAIVRAEQVAWVAVSTGCWMPEVSMTLHSANGRLHREYPRIPVPADAVIVAGDEETMTHALFDKTLQRRALAHYRSK